MPDTSPANRMSELIDELAAMTTEAARDSIDLDTLETLELVRLMNLGDQSVPLVVAHHAPQIAQAVDGIVERFRRGGRLIYLGAGTAGRMGVLDASECPPTFGTPPEMVRGLIAGGPTALMTAVENAEDDDRAAAVELAELGLTDRDVVVGISASGRTPYVVGGLRYAREIDALTIAVAQNADSVIGRIADIPIEVVVGPEFVAGSTRLKSGTAQKLVLNMLSTLAMVRLGKTYRGIMVDLLATNEKLRARSIRTVMTVSGVGAEQAEAALDAADGRVKEAILALLTGIAPDTAGRLLDEADGLLRVAVERASAA
ncbi:N-acetylmuramic acid 6-phosphate etherase [Microbacterium sp. Root61]|uniref:N-acetylmuramic acid 6-phosphate etherase n=1 Tax=Microbacterium sp. Root61 TaxID=1736570 RepID=UPI000701F3CA|nr:N-acetylmuramic acid 6-phosphate etherase [Microbacterium sp. Root61]KRA25209.1 N-acetylmuramic acid 6-phosphate etherase [Microbacterium sp. Root61]